jgi:hypothetical protein
MTNNMEKIDFNPTINSLAEFTEKIIEFGNHPINEGQKIWYRGHASKNYKLIPTLYREVLDLRYKRSDQVIRPSEIRAIERGIDLSFARQGLSFLTKKGIANTDMNRYFLKQHYKVKTRLLDWTESALVALYFALSAGHQKGDDAVVYLLLPFELNNFSIRTLKNETDITAHMIFSSINEISKKEALFNEKSELRINQLISKYYKLDVDENEKQYPIALYPPYLDERMAAQQACFTLFGNIYYGLSPQQLEKDFIYSISIPASQKHKILQEMRILGFSDFSIFPDLDGLGNSINTEYQTILNGEWTKDGFELMKDHLKDSLLADDKE